MVKATHKAVSSTIPRKELLGAAKKFLLHPNSNKELILVGNVDSPRFGSSDLLFVNKVKPSVTIVRLDNNKEECEKFFISSISYYLWFKEFMTVSEIFFNAKSGLDMYLFSGNSCASICRVVQSLSETMRVHLIKYDILQVEGLDEPAIYFQHVTPEDLVHDKPLGEEEGREKDTTLTEHKEQSPTLEISAEELSEFDRLRKRYLA